MEQADDGIDRMLNQLVEREGGFVDHPDDRGGATRYGVTEAVARAMAIAARCALCRATRR